MQTVYISIGSNLGDRVKNCIKAIDEISRFSEVSSVSSFYKTEPVGNEEQPLFINCAVEIATELSPHMLLDKLLEIENRLGRVRKEKWGPRIIDLDIIFYGQEIIDDPDLVIPHPEAHKRRFVLEPLREIAPECIHPIINVSVEKLLEETKDIHGVVKM